MAPSTRRTPSTDTATCQPSEDAPTAIPAPAAASTAATPNARIAGRGLITYVVVATRRGWDSNPRSVATRPLSRRLH